MHEYEIKFVKAIVWRLVFTGLMTLILGILILIYPIFLVILVGAGLIISGLMFLSLAHKVNHYSKIKIKL